MRTTIVLNEQLVAAAQRLPGFRTKRGLIDHALRKLVRRRQQRRLLELRWPDLIDIDAGRIATGEATIEDVGWEIFRFILEVASGRRKTWAEHWKLHNALIPFNPGPIT